MKKSIAQTPLPSGLQPRQAAPPRRFGKGMSNLGPVPVSKQPASQPASHQPASQQPAGRPAKQPASQPKERTTNAFFLNFLNSVPIKPFRAVFRSDKPISVLGARYLFCFGLRDLSRCHHRKNQFFFLKLGVAIVLNPPKIQNELSNIT